MAHTFDTKLRMPTTANTTATTNPLTASYTPGAGTTVLVLAIIYAGGTARGGGNPTFNSVELTMAGAARKGTTSPEASCELWYLLAPPIGAYTVSIPNSGGLALSAEVSTYKAASGKASVLDVASGQNGATSTNPTTASFTTTVNGDAIVAVVANGAQSWATTVQTGTIIYNSDNGSWGGGSQYLMQATAGNTTMGWTFATSEDWGVQAVAFKEVTPPLTLNLSDTITFSDEVVKGLRKVNADTITFSDSPSKALSKSFADTITFSDAISKSLNKQFADTLTLSDETIKSIGKQLSDTITFSEAIAKGLSLQLSDTITFTDEHGISGASEYLITSTGYLITYNNYLIKRKQ